MVAVGGVPMLLRVLAAVEEVGASPVVVVGPRREQVPAGVLVVREEPPGGGPVAAAAAGLGAIFGDRKTGSGPQGVSAAVDAAVPGEQPGVDGRHDTVRPDGAAAVAKGVVPGGHGRVRGRYETVGPDGAAASPAGSGRNEILDARAVAGGPGGEEESRPDVVLLLAADLPHLSGQALRVLLDAVQGHDGAVFVDGSGRRQLLCGAWRSGALLGAVQGFGVVEGGAIRRLVSGLEVAEVRWDGERAPYFDCDTQDDLREAGS
uniref:NTP transferase domain-containing protein n=1 Tax=Dactylosporangium vinaceum TaxID=53362 RepID=A0ABV5MPI0_9ACTN